MKFWVLIILTAAFQFGVHAQAEPKKVVIFYSTGGHSTAAKSIEQQILANSPGTIVIRKDFAQEIKGFARWFHLKGYDLISKYAPFINRVGTKAMWDESADDDIKVSDRRASQFNQPPELLKYLNQEKPDVIIATHFGAAEAMAVLREQGELQNTPIAWAHLDMVDNNFFRQIGEEMDMTFLPSQGMAAAWSQVMNPGKVRASGMPIMQDMTEPLDKTQTAATKIKLGLNPQVHTILLMGGSMGALPYKQLIESLFSKVPPNQSLQILAVCGRNEAAYKQLSAWSAQTGPRLTVQPYGFIPLSQVRELQTASDSVISKPGGLSTFELLSTGVPVILTEGIGLQEVYNAQYVQKEGAAIYVAKTPDVARVWSAVLNDPEKQQSLVANQKRLLQTFNFAKITDWVEHPTVLANKKNPPKILSKIETRPPVCDAVFNH